MRGHAQNLKRPGVVPEDLLRGDALGFLNQACAWSRFAEIPTLCVRFEHIWDHLEKVREFTGLPLVLPVRRERTSKIVPPDIDEELRAAFAPIDAALKELPPIAVRG
jgi:hypothetical protein